MIRACAWLISSSDVLMNASEDRSDHAPVRFNVTDVRGDVVELGVRATFVHQRGRGRQGDFRDRRGRPRAAAPCSRGIPEDRTAIGLPAPAMPLLSVFESRCPSTLWWSAEAFQHREVAELGAGTLEQLQIRRGHTQRGQLAVT